MGTPIFVNDILYVQSIIQEVNLQQTAVITRFLKVTSIVAPGVVTFGDVAAAVDALVGTRYNVLINNNADYLGTRVRRLRPVGLEAWENSTASANTGVAGAVAMPGQVTGLIRFTTNQIGKRGVGRLYIPFPAAADNILEGVPRPGYMTAAQSLGQRYVIQVTVTAGAAIYTLDWVLVTRGGVPVERRVLDSLPVKAWATQRRRGSFGRFNKPPF